MNETTGNRDAFLQEFLPAREELLAFTFSMLSSYAEAEDVFQEASLLLWREFDTFTPGTNFRAWARKVIYYKVLSARARGGREKVWTPEVFEALDRGFDATTTPFAQMKDALSECLRKLSESARRLILYKYEQGRSIRQIAQLLDRSEAGTKTMLHKIRRKLANCVRKALQLEAL